MATYSFRKLIMGKVEIRNFYCLIWDNRILFLQKCLLNSSPHFLRLLSELLNLIGCRDNIQLCKYQISNAGVSNISVPVVKNGKLTFSVQYV